MKKGLTKSFIFIWLLISLSGYKGTPESTQETEKKKQIEDIKDDEDMYPEIPSNFTTITLDWGISSFLNAPSQMDLIFWRSRILGGTIYYNIPVGKSHFMFSGGLGIANADYMFKPNKPNQSECTLARDKNGKTQIIEAKRVIQDNPEIQKSMFSINYLDFIGELRFNSDKEEPREGFFIAVGGSVGFQLSPYTSIAYKENEEKKVRITKESFNTRKFRYGVLARIGWNRFGIFYNQTLSGLFNDKGPTKDTILPFSVGISANLL